MQKFNLSFFIAIILTLLFFSSCSKNDELKKSDIQTEKTDIELRVLPSLLEWNVREPEFFYFSLIKGGTPPYSISKTFSVAAGAQIVKDTIYVFPNKPGFTKLGTDSLTIVDYSGDSIQLKVNVNTLFIEYKTIDSARITIYGDTNLVASFGGNFQTFWDAHTKEFKMLIFNNNASLRIQLDDITSRGTYKVNYIFYNPLWNNQRIYLSNKDSLQEVTFTQLDRQAVKINFDYDAYDDSNFYNGKINIKGVVHLSR